LIDFHKWEFQIHYEFPLRLPVHNINFDFSSEAIAKESSVSNGCFQQLILDNRRNLHEISIFTDGSSSSSEDRRLNVGCDSKTIHNFDYTDNHLSSSFTAEAIVILKVMEKTVSERWTAINICSDSMSVLMKLKSDLSFIFPFVKSNLSPIMAEFLLKVTKVTFFGN